MSVEPTASDRPPRAYSVGFRREVARLARMTDLIVDCGSTLDGYRVRFPHFSGLACFITDANELHAAVCQAVQEIDTPGDFSLAAGFAAFYAATDRYAAVADMLVALAGTHAAARA